MINLHELQEEQERNIIKQFKKELFRANLNLPELDGKPCAKCGKIPPIIRKRIKRKWVVDRTSRVDCDSGEKKEKLETYCIECWREIALANSRNLPLDTAKIL